MFSRPRNVRGLIGEVSGDFPESGGNPCPVCLGTDFDFVVGLNLKVVLKCKRCGFVKEVVPWVNANTLSRAKLTNFKFSIHHR